MPRAEAGSTKHLANKMKAKGLQRLRWYCQVCEKQCRDENGFKCHTQSESHVRQMQAIGSNAKAVIHDYSQQFVRDFVAQLRTSHHTKAVHINHFYQEYIANKEHVHMNSTRWPSLTEFAKHLGRESLCRVEETEKGLHIAWIDNSPEALRRQEAIRQKERMERGDEEREQKLIQQQIARAQAQRRAGEEDVDEVDMDRARELQREGEEKIVFSFGKKKDEGPLTPPKSDDDDKIKQETGSSEEQNGIKEAAAPAAEDAKVGKISLGATSLASKPKNVFSGPKKGNAFSSKGKGGAIEQPKKVSEAERIMKAEMQRKRPAGGGVGFSMAKKPKLGA